MKTDPEADLRAAAEQQLRALVGSDAARLRDDQWTAIEALVAQRARALVVQRTGWGKSAVYFVATALLRQRGAGPTVIISPLLALMRNQIAAAERAGIRAVTINSGNLEEWAGIHAAIAANQTDVLLVSPERLNNPDFRDNVLPGLAASAGLLVVDEAHCISDWGHDFRPDYRRIRSILAELPAGIPVLATTATANARVTADVAEQLSISTRSSSPGRSAEVAETPDEVLVLRGDLDRSSLHLAVIETATPAERLAWLGAHLAQLPGSGIIYCLTVAATQDVTQYLRGCGYQVSAYSGQTDTAERVAAEDDLLANRVKALVATSALGMGFDKPDLGWVVNLGAPPSPIAYYQQVGRAGRATERATVVLLPGREDREVWDYFGSLSFPPEGDVRRALAVLADTDVAMSTATLETFVELRRTRLEQMLKVLDVDGAVRRVRGGWRATGVEWAYDRSRYERVQAARRHEQQAMLDYITTDGCRMQFLRSALDDAGAGAARCGRCDNCGGIDLPRSVPAAGVVQARAEIERAGVVVEPRRMWPTGVGELGLRGKISAGEAAEPGRAIARLTDLGWGGALRALFDPGSADAEIPVPLRHALAAVLEAWEFDVSPDVVVGLTSATRPVLTDHLADGMSRLLRIPLVARFDIVGSARPGEGSMNSAHRLRAVIDRFALTDPAAVDGRTVLLTDDRTDTGWTLAVCARALRGAGARAVYPLVLATTA